MLDRLKFSGTRFITLHHSSLVMNIRFFILRKVSAYFVDLIICLFVRTRIRTTWCFGELLGLWHRYCILLIITQARSLVSFLPKWRTVSSINAIMIRVSISVIALIIIISIQIRVVIIGSLMVNAIAIVVSLWIGVILKSFWTRIVSDYFQFGKTRTFLINILYNRSLRIPSGVRSALIMVIVHLSVENPESFTFRNGSSPIFIFLLNL